MELKILTDQFIIHYTPFWTLILADVDANLIYKLSEALSPQEILELVNAIASAVENPDQRPLCKR